MSDPIKNAIEAMEFAQHAVGPFHRVATKKLRESIAELKAAQAQAGDGEAVGKVYYTGNGFLDVDWYTSDIPDDALLYTRPQPAQVNRQDLINLLIATRTQSEGVTADLIINMVDAKPAVNQQLLDALQDLLAYVEQGIGDIESDEGRKARAAIAAAQEQV